MRVTNEPGGGHHIIDEEYDVVLVRVRPVGTLEWGDLPMFVPTWVPRLVEALQLAQRIGDRDKPWESWEEQ